MPQCFLFRLGKKNRKNKTLFLLAIAFTFVFFRCQSVSSKNNKETIPVVYPENAVEEYLLQEEIIRKLNSHKEFSFVIRQSRDSDVTYVSQGVNQKGENLTLYVIHFFVSHEGASKMYHSMQDSKMPMFEYGAMVIFLPEGDRSNIAVKLADILKGMGFKVI